MPGATILCIDDDEPSLLIRGKILEKFGYRILSATSARQGLELFAREQVDAVLLDYFMPEMNGAQVAAELKRSGSEVPVLLLSSAIFFPEDARGLVDAFCAKIDGPANFIAALKKLLNGRGDGLPARPPEA